MNCKTFAEIILFSSSIGLGGIIALKIPALSALPEITVKENKEELDPKEKERPKKKNFLIRPSSNIFLQKILTKIRILSLKTDTKTFTWLQKLRENNQRKKIKENDSYWDDIRSSSFYPKNVSSLPAAEKKKPTKKINSL
jgi:hypothetical protein